jgi:DNA-binding beta-propeller fold protein YncE
VTQNDNATVSRVSDPLGTSPTVTSYSLPAGSDPSGVALSPDGTKVYVVEEGAKQVQELDASDGSILHTSAAGAVDNVPSGIAVTPDGDVWTGNDALTAFTPDLASTLDLGALGTEGFAGPPLVSPDATTMYVGRDDSIQVIDTTTHRLTGTISTTTDAGLADCAGCTALGQQITHLALTPDGKTLYATSYDYPWRAKIDLAGDDPTITLLPGPVANDADATDDSTWQYSNQMQVVGDALWTASDGSNYDGTIVQRDPIAPEGSFGSEHAQTGDTVTITGSGLADAAVYLDGTAVSLTYDDFSKLSFTMPAYATERSLTVSVATPSTGATPVDFGPLDYTLRTLSGPAPSVTGTLGGKAHVGATLTANPGQWPAGTVVHYQWMYNESWTPIPGATGATYTPTAADYTGKHTIVVTTWATGSGYTASEPTESAAYAVAAGTLKKSRPAIAGKAKVGRRLRAKHRTWTAGTRFRYRWYASGKKIRHATKASYKIAEKYAGKKITVRVIGSKTGYLTAKATSKPTHKVARR